MCSAATNHHLLILHPDTLNFLLALALHLRQLPLQGFVLFADALHVFVLLLELLGQAVYCASEFVHLQSDPSLSTDTPGIQLLISFSPLQSLNQLIHFLAHLLLFFFQVVIFILQSNKQFIQVLVLKMSL